MSVRAAVYIGDIEELRGKTALIRNDVGVPTGRVEAMFDDEDLVDTRGAKTKWLGLEWHRFPESDFEPIRNAE